MKAAIVASLVGSAAAFAPASNGKMRINVVFPLVYDCAALLPVFFT
jgi:hypothetical protein